MLRNYIKIAFRNIIRNKGFSILNISGLAIGMASAVLILLWIQNEISYDSFHVNKAQLFQVWNSNQVGGEIQSGPQSPEVMAPFLQKDVPEIEQVSRITWGENPLFSVGNKSLKVSGNMVDPAFLQMFSFPLLR